MNKHGNNIKLLIKPKIKILGRHKKGSGFLFCPLQKQNRKKKTTKKKTENKIHKGRGHKSGEGH